MCNLGKLRRVFEQIVHMLERPCVQKCDAELTVPLCMVHVSCQHVVRSCWYSVTGPINVFNIYRYYSERIDTSLQFCTLHNIKANTVCILTINSNLLEKKII